MAANPFHKGLYGRYLPKKAVDTIKAWFQFRPTQAHAANASAGLDNNVQMEGVPGIKGYRYPAPGSQPLATVPSLESTDALYDTKYFSRDTVRYLPAPDFTIHHPALGEPETPEPNAGMLGGSPGNNNPAVLAYDPTGLRSAMSATNEETDKELLRHAPDHLVLPRWWAQQEALMKTQDEAGLPPTPGVPVTFNVPKWAQAEGW